MGFDFHFTSLQDIKQLKELVDFIAVQNLGYPKYESWVQRTEHELISGYKQAIMAFSNGKLVGDLIWQPHKGLAKFLEIKNLRIHPALRIRDFGRFMLRQVEVDNSSGYSAAICDTKSDKPQIARFLISCGYHPIATIPLYDSSSPDVTMVKFLHGQKEQLTTIASNFIYKNAN